MADATLNDLRALAVALPPSERLASGEVGDVLSAVIAVQHYGEDILTAAKEGKIGDYFHDLAVKAAEEAGTDEPRRGTITDAPVTPTQASDNRADRLEKKVEGLADDFRTLIDALKSQQGAEVPTTPTEPAA